MAVLRSFSKQIIANPNARHLRRTERARDLDVCQGQGHLDWVCKPLFLGEAIDVVVKLAIFSLLSLNSPFLRQFEVSYVLNLGLDLVLKPKTQQSLNLRG